MKLSVALSALAFIAAHVPEQIIASGMDTSNRTFGQYVAKTTLMILIEAQSRQQFSISKPLRANATPIIASLANTNRLYF